MCRDIKSVRAGRELSDSEAKQLSPLALAYIGDAVFESYVREIIVLTDASRHTYEMHRRATKVVNASSQAAILNTLTGMLSEDEKYIAQRGKNAKPHSVPRNADILDYKAATGFEALIGYLYITGRSERMCEILEASCKIGGLWFEAGNGVE